MSREVLVEEIKKDAHAAYDRREAEVGEEVMRELERRVVLSVLDRKWREHLYEMDYLREGIDLRAYSQRDPLVEYQREGFDMFATMMDGIKEESVGFLFNLDVEVEARTTTRTTGWSSTRPPASRSTPSRCARRSRRSSRSPRRPPPRVARRSGRRASTGPSSRSGSPTPPRARTVTPRCARRRPPASDDPFAGVGRNALCPCGSGKKYKRCHGAPGGPTGLTARVSG